MEHVEDEVGREGPIGAGLRVDIDLVAGNGRRHRLNRFVHARGRVVGLAVGVLTTAITVVALTVAGGPASAISAPIHITSTVNVRPGPSTSSGNPLGTLPGGASPDFHCWTQGQNIYGVDVWFNVTYGSLNGYYASYYDDSSYPTDSQITAKYGIPQCGSGPAPAPAPAPPPPGGSSAAVGAVNWARAQVGSSAYHNLCLTFVFQAYSAAGVNLRPFVTVPINSNTYPADIWNHFNHGTVGSGSNPPTGALVFWASRTGDRTLSHVTISTGGGQLVSTSDSINNSVIHYETMSQRSYSIELGWWMPV